MCTWNATLFFLHNLLWMAKISTFASQEVAGSSSSLLSQGEAATPSRAKECVPGSFAMTSDFKVERPSSNPEHHEPVTRYISSITNVGRRRADCYRGDTMFVEISAREEDITAHKARFLSVNNYPGLVWLS
uniref:Uncharacterized protein LOC104223392 n=1 Tax=Nicotiana sylvestris TaxID=4096 RepID=A0A1U7VZD3_NICSY|nr:PREDICTED: uncharacterized protein LOC104223392 [Nicotiana sylvestris]